jgi:hypothetical protein
VSGPTIFHSPNHKSGAALIAKTCVRFVFVNGKTNENERSFPMKNQIMMAIAAAGLMTGCATREYRVASLRQLPFPVQQTIREESPTGNISHVEKRNHGGQAVYSVSFNDPVMNPPMVIASDGTLLGGGRGIVMPERERMINESAGGEAPLTMRVEDLPLPVQNAIRAQAPDAKIVSVHKQFRPGVVYDVRVANPGATRSLHIADDGTILEGD